MNGLGWNLLIATHVVAAVLSVVVGATNLVRRRKGDLAHRILGRTWLATMYFVSVSSFWIKELRPGQFSWIHALSAFTIVTLSLGWWNARRGNIPAHAGNMIGTYIGLVGAGTAAAAVPARLIPRSFGADWTGMLTFTALVVAAGLGIVWVVTMVVAARMPPVPAAALR